MNWRNARVRHAPALIDQMTVTQLMPFVSTIVQIYTIGNGIGKTLNDLASSKVNESKPKERWRSEEVAQ